MWYELRYRISCLPGWRVEKRFRGGSGVEAGDGRVWFTFKNSSSTFFFLRNNLYGRSFNRVENFLFSCKATSVNWPMMQFPKMVLPSYLSLSDDRLLQTWWFPELVELDGEIGWCLPLEGQKLLYGIKGRQKKMVTRLLKMATILINFLAGNVQENQHDLTPPKINLQFWTRPLGNIARRIYSVIRAIIIRSNSFVPRSNHYIIVCNSVLEYQIGVCV